MPRIAFISAYLVSMAAAVVLLNANVGTVELALAVWAIVSVLLGWGTGQMFFALLAFVAIPFAVPFGYPDNYEFSEPLPIWWDAAICSLLSAGLILIGAIVRLVVNAKKPRRSEASSESG
jgi:hypothetical protein